MFSENSLVALYIIDWARTKPPSHEIHVKGILGTSLGYNIDIRKTSQFVSFLFYVIHYFAPKSISNCPMDIDFALSA